MGRNCNKPVELHSKADDLHSPVYKQKAQAILINGSVYTVFARIKYI